MMRLDAQPLAGGAARGELVVLEAPLSLWGGLDLATGAIADATHPQVGLNLRGRIVAMPFARGSSSSSSALVEAARNGAAPAGILLMAPDPILLIGSIVAADLYGIAVPIAQIASGDWMALQNHRLAEVSVENGHAIIVLN